MSDPRNFGGGTRSKNNEDGDRTCEQPARQARSVLYPTVFNSRDSSHRNGLTSIDKDEIKCSSLYSYDKDDNCAVLECDTNSVPFIDGASSSDSETPASPVPSTKYISPNSSGDTTQCRTTKVDSPPLSFKSPTLDHSSTTSPTVISSSSIVEENAALFTRPLDMPISPGMFSKSSSSLTNTSLASPSMVISIENQRSHLNSSSSVPSSTITHVSDSSELAYSAITMNPNLVSSSITASNSKSYLSKPNSVLCSTSILAPSSSDKASQPVMTNSALASSTPSTALSVQVSSSNVTRRKYSSPFVYASPYSSYAARRTSLRSPSLWANERVTMDNLPSLTTSYVNTPSYRRKSYVTPTFGGNDDNLIMGKLSGQFEDYTRPIEMREDSDDMNIKQLVDNRRQDDNELPVRAIPSEVLSLPQMPICPSFNSGILRPNNSGSEPCRTSSLGEVYFESSLEPIKSVSTSSVNYAEAENNETLNATRVLNAYATSENKNGLCRRFLQPDYYSNPLYDLQPEGQSTPILSGRRKHSNDGGIESRSFVIVHEDPDRVTNQHVDWKTSAVIVNAPGVSFPSSLSTSSWLGSSRFSSTNASNGLGSSEQKRMSIIDGRLKVLPEQLIVVQDRLAQQGDSFGPEDVAAVMENVIKFEGEDLMRALITWMITVHKSYPVFACMLWLLYTRS